MLLLVSFQPTPPTVFLREKMGGQLSKKKKTPWQQPHGRARASTKNWSLQAITLGHRKISVRFFDKNWTENPPGNTSISPTQFWTVGMGHLFFVNTSYCWQETDVGVRKWYEIVWFPCGGMLLTFWLSDFRLIGMLKRQDSLKRQAQYARNPASPGILQTIYPCIK